MTVRVHGKPIGDRDAAELARWLRASTTLETGIADRLDRCVDDGGGLVATNRAEAGAILAAVAGMSSEEPVVAERLEELTRDLASIVASEE